MSLPEPYYRDGAIQLFNADCLNILYELEAESLDSLATDPPAGIGFMGHSWDSDKGGRLRWIDWLAAIMAEARRVLKPGAHGLVWALPRTSHWTATALEEAGFEIRDVIHHLFGTGFPKSKNLGDGWGTALKPASEHWILVRNPCEGSATANHGKYGTGGINVDGCRIETDEDLNGGAYACRPSAQGVRRWEGGALDATGKGYEQPSGRFPANVILSPDAAEEMDRQSGVRGPGARPKKRNGSHFGNGKGTSDENRIEYDSGGASRFFYVPKPSAAERGEGNRHPTVKPLTLMRYLTRMITPTGGTILDPFAGSGITGVAAAHEGFMALLIEAEHEYARISARACEEATRQGVLPLETA